MKFKPGDIVQFRKDRHSAVLAFYGEIPEYGYITNIRCGGVYDVAWHLSDSEKYGLDRRCTTGDEIELSALGLCRTA